MRLWLGTKLCSLNKRWSSYRYNVHVYLTQVFTLPSHSTLPTTTHTPTSPSPLCTLSLHPHHYIHSSPLHTLLLHPHHYALSHSTLVTTYTPHHYTHSPHHPSLISPSPNSRWSTVLKRVQVFLAAELTHFIVPVSNEGGWTYHQWGEGGSIHVASTLK